MTPRERIDAYFLACGEGSAEDIASHFTDDAVVWDTNIRPMRGATDIGRSWVKVRERWGGARWLVDSCVTAPDERTAAIEWHMTGTNPADGRTFVFRGSEHYRFDDTGCANTVPANTVPSNTVPDAPRIAEIRQYWTFDPDRLDTGLVGYDYTAGPGAATAADGAAITG